jgi:hypothetical protein
MTAQPDLIHVDSFVLADSAQVVGDKLFVLGGGWNYLNLGRPNSQVDLIALVGRILVPIQESNRDFDLLIHLEHAADLLGGPRFRLVLRPKEIPDLQRSVETATPFVIEIFGLNFQWAGEYAFVISHEKKELARSRFEVRFLSAD